MLSEAVQVQELSQGERTKACIRRDPEGYARQDLEDRLLPTLAFLWLRGKGLRVIGLHFFSAFGSSSYAECSATRAETTSG